MNTILPCPFCGGPAKVGTFPGKPGHGCADTNCAGWHCWTSLDKWNRRAQDDKQVSVTSEAAAREAAAWKETAEQGYRDRDFYRGIVVQIGEMFGREAYISDDGSIQQDVLALKVPELVAKHMKAPEGMENILGDLRHACKWAWDADLRNMVISRDTIETIISRYESAAQPPKGEGKE